MKLEQVKTCNENKATLLKDLEKELAEIEKQGADEKFPKGRKWRGHKSKVLKKIKQLRLSFERGITFGGRSTVQKISFLHNELHVSRKEKERIKYAAAIQKTTDEYHEKRVLPLTIIGEAPQKSNRKFDFDFTNKKVVFKPSKSVKIPIEFYASEGHMRTLEKLQSKIGEMPIMVRLTEDYIQVVFDEERLAGFEFKDREYKRERNAIKSGSEKAEYKSCKQKWLIEQQARKLVGKLENIYVSVDLNPEYIGVAVLRKTKNGFDILDKSVFAIQNLNTALGVASTHEEQLKQNNKRDHEIKEIWKKIFKMAAHYRAAYFVMEDLEFKEKGINTHAKSANKKVKNLWYRELTGELIERHCKESGIEKILRNPCYSSFIGNIKHTFYDPLNAAIEIGRRGMYAFEKWAFFPKIESRDFDTMSRDFALDVRDKTLSNWVEIYQLFKAAGLRYRRGLDDCSKFVESNLSSHKSKVKLLRF